jgi:hypothetical protein
MRRSGELPGHSLDQPERIGDVFRRSRDAILLKHSNTVTERFRCGALI